MIIFYNIPRVEIYATVFEVRNIVIKSNIFSKKRLQSNAFSVMCLLNVTR